MHDVQHAAMVNQKDQNQRVKDFLPRSTSGSQPLPLFAGFSDKGLRTCSAQSCKKRCGHTFGVHRLAIHELDQTLAV